MKIDYFFKLNFILLYFLFFLLPVLSNINFVYGKGLDIRCVSSEYECHDHYVYGCQQNSNAYYDDYVAGANALVNGKCPFNNDSGETPRVIHTSDACINICTEYALYIDGSRIDTIEGFIRQMPVSELINLLDTVTLQKIYDPNMTSVNP